MKAATIDYEAAAIYLGISRRSLQKLVNSGEVAHCRISGTLVRFRFEDLDAYLDRLAARSLSPSARAAAAAVPAPDKPLRLRTPKAPAPPAVVNGIRRIPIDY